MLCENCDQAQATGYIEETKNGIKRRINLCSRCVLEKQKAIFGVNMFSGLLNTPTTSLIKKRCTACNTFLDTIINTLFAGCPNCYVELAPHLNPLIINLHGTATHREV